jgi:hypothetical protein
MADSMVVAGHLLFEVDRSDVLRGLYVVDILEVSFLRHFENHSFLDFI